MSIEERVLIIKFLNSFGSILNYFNTKNVPFLYIIKFVKWEFRGISNNKYHLFFQHDSETEVTEHLWCFIYGVSWLPKMKSEPEKITDDVTDSVETGAR